MLALVTNVGQHCCSGKDGGWIGQAAYADDGPEGCDMGSLGPTQLTALLLAVATIAAIGGFVASGVARRNKRRTRRLFLVGFFCGLMAGAILHGRRRGLNALRALAARTAIRPPRAGIRGDTVRFATRALGFAASRVRIGLRSPQWHRPNRKVLMSARY
jgi:hypothetical protein